MMRRLRVPLDTGVFPNALCNDGSGAVMFVRPASDVAHQDQWVIQLKGGGRCGDPDGCLQRWCSVDTPFGATQMAGDPLSPMRTTMGGTGMLSRDPADGSPFADYNQVYVQYCSSDQWSGTRRDAVVQSHYPCEPGGTCPSGAACPTEGAFRAMCEDQPVGYRIHFLGRPIMDAVVSTLRRDGVGPLTHQGQTLPDLDTASEVVLIGGSAGGNGVINNIDHLAEVLRANNDACTGSDCPLRVLGIVDSAHSLDLPQTTGWADSLPCSDTFDEQLCSYADYMAWLATAPRMDNLWWKLGDQSCETWHADHPEDGSNDLCTDQAHVLRHHVTTPHLVRQALADPVISQVDLALGLDDETGAPLDSVTAWGVQVRRDLLDYETWSTWAEEADAAERAPAVFAPACNQHETLSNQGEVYGTLIYGLGADRDVFDVWEYWEGGDPAVLVTPDIQSTTCP